MIQVGLFIKQYIDFAQAKYRAQMEQLGIVGDEM